MPHIILQYSKNVEDDLDISTLLDKLHQNLADHETFYDDRIKSRTIGHGTYRIGRGESNNAFIHTSIVFSQGRSTELRKRLGENLLKVIESHVDDAATGLAVSRSLEIRQFEDNMYFRE